ncbi:MAG: hypothetical protein NVS2B5_19490 [Beijerinckiaceae bacterium]
MEEVDGRPQQVFEVGFETRVIEGRDEGVENIAERAADHCLVGQGSPVRLVLMWTVAIDLKLVDDAIGRG